MILKYIGEEQDDAPAKARAPLTIGQRYEVAEIYEWPWRLMVRQPGETRGPAPGSPWFGWSADEFEDHTEPIPILRCGFEHIERFMHFYGALLSQPRDIERFRALYYLRPPHFGETFEAWFASPQAELSAAARYYAPDLPPLSADVGRAYYDWQHFPAHSFGPAESGVVDEAVAAEPALKAPFLFVGRSWEPQCCQACLDARTAALKACLERLLASLGIAGVAVGPTRLRFWQRAESETALEEEDAGDEHGEEPEPSEEERW